MDIIYCIIFIGAFLIEVSEKISTRNLLKKLGLGFIMIGAILAMAHKTTFILVIGLCGYLLAELTSAYLHRYERRSKRRLI